MITIVPTVRISCLYPPRWIYYYRFQLICDHTFAILLLFRGILLKMRWYRCNLRGNEKIRINVSFDSTLLLRLFFRVTVFLNEYRSRNSSITRSIISSFSRHDCTIFIFDSRINYFHGTNSTRWIFERHRIYNRFEKAYSVSTWWHWISLKRWLLRSKCCWWGRYCCWQSCFSQVIVGFVSPPFDVRLFAPSPIGDSHPFGKQRGLFIKRKGWGMISGTKASRSSSE